MSIPDSQIEVLVVTILAAGGFGVERVTGLLPALRRSGLVDPVHVAKQDVSEVMMLLAREGYDRGLITEMMAGRLMNLMISVVEGRLDGLKEFVASNNRAPAIQLLCTVRGIGPKVASNAWHLIQNSVK